MKYINSVIALSLIILGAATGFAAQSTYTIPEALKPMSTWRNG